jgi:hypothetical protein
VALQKSQEMTQARKNYYDSREKVNGLEKISLGLSAATIPLIAESAHLRILAGLLEKVGGVKMGSPTTAGVEIGPYFFGVSLEEAALALDAGSSVLSISSQLAGRMAEYGRRQDDWSHQANLAAVELKQVESQVLAAQVRLAVAEQELRNHDRQMENAREVDQFLRDKFTTQDLYQWMIGQISGLYFQSYQLAYDVAKRAERCMQHELGFKDGETNFIRFGYWDSLKKGLLAGDHLAYDLKRLDIAYLDGNVREYELTKHVSLRQLNPRAVLALKATGACEVTLPEWLYDLDGPGHYMRRLKNVSLSIPSVTGPYTSVSCTLTLLKSSVRKSHLLSDGEYARRPSDDDRFVDYFGAIQSIVTSSSNNDSGMFETSLRDERYLPFEGAGAESTWKLELPTDFRQFDYNTISDAILHVRYTARQGDAQLRDKAVKHIEELAREANTSELALLFSLRHDFPTEWYRFVTGTNNFVATIRRDHFPYLTQGKAIKINTLQVHAIQDGKLESVIPQGFNLPQGLDAEGAFEFSLAPDGTVLIRNKDANVFILIKYSVRSS